MTWPTDWADVLNGLEALGVLAVVFAIGNGVGFWLSSLTKKRVRRRPTERTSAPRAPVDIPEDMTDLHAAASEPIPGEMPVAAVAPEPEPTPAAPPPVSPPSPAFTLRARYPVNQFGTISLTRSSPDHPSN